MSHAHTIMVIDDDMAQLRIVKQLLSKEQYNVQLAGSGAEAVEQLNNNPLPQLILLDVSMPDMNGYDTYELIKQQHDIPTIFLTASGDADAELTGLRLGAIDYITKPFDLDILLARIKNHLNIIHGKHAANDSGQEAVFKFDGQKLSAMKELLTDSEFKVAKMIALGLTNQEIADKYNYSYTYVKKIAYRIFDKIGINKRNEIRPYFF